MSEPDTPTVNDMAAAEHAVIAAAVKETDAEYHQAALMRALTARKRSHLPHEYDEAGKAVAAAKTARRDAVRKLETLEAAIHNSTR